MNAIIIIANINAHSNNCALNALLSLSFMKGPSYCFLSWRPLESVDLIGHRQAATNTRPGFKECTTDE